MMGKQTVRKKIRLVKNKRSINPKVSQKKKMKKTKRDLRSIVPKRRKTNLKIKLKIDLLARKSLKNDFISRLYHRIFEKYIIFYHIHSSYLGGVRFSLGFATNAVIYSAFSSTKLFTFFKWAFYLSGWFGFAGKFLLDNFLYLSFYCAFLSAFSYSLSCFNTSSLGFFWGGDLRESIFLYYIFELFLFVS